MFSRQAYQIRKWAQGWFLSKTKMSVIPIVGTAAKEGEITGDELKIDRKIRHDFNLNYTLTSYVD